MNILSQMRKPNNTMRSPSLDTGASSGRELSQGWVENHIRNGTVRIVIQQP